MFDCIKCQELYDCICFLTGPQSHVQFTVEALATTTRQRNDALARIKKLEKIIADSHREKIEVTERCPGEFPVTTFNFNTHKNTVSGLCWICAKPPEEHHARTP